MGAYYVIFGINNDEAITSYSHNKGHESYIQNMAAPMNCWFIYCKSEDEKVELNFSRLMCLLQWTELPEDFYEVGEN